MGIGKLDIDINCPAVVHNVTRVCVGRFINDKIK